MNCKFGVFDVVITRAYSANPAQAKRGMVASFSFNLVDPNTKVVFMVCNNFTLYRDGKNYQVHSAFHTITDHDAPEEIPDDKAVKPLYFTSFFPGAKNDETIKNMRINFFDSLAQAVLTKIEEFKKKRELSNTNRQAQAAN